MQPNTFFIMTYILIYRTVKIVHDIKNKVKFTVYYTDCIANIIF